MEKSHWPGFPKSTESQGAVLKKRAQTARAGLGANSCKVACVSSLWIHVLEKSNVSLTWRDLPLAPLAFLFPQFVRLLQYYLCTCCSLPGVPFPLLLTHLDLAILQAQPRSLLSQEVPGDCRGAERLNLTPYWVTWLALPICGCLVLLTFCGGQEGVGWGRSCF